MMKKHNALLMAMLAAFSVSAAQAGTVTGGGVIATEQAPTAASTLTLTNMGVTYQFSGLPASGQAITAGTTIYAYVKITGGAFNTPVVTAAGFNAAPTVGAVILNTAKDVMAVPLTIAGAGTVVIPNTANIVVKGTVDVANPQALNVTAAGYLDLVGAAPTAATAFTVPATTQDSTATPATVLTAAAAIGGTVAATAETAKLSVTSTPFASTTTAGLAAAGKVNLATVTFTDVTGTQSAYGGGTPTGVDIGAAAASAMSVTITPAAGNAFSNGQTFGLFTDTACTTAIVGATVTKTATPALTAAQAALGDVASTTTSLALDVTAAWPASAAKTYVCMTAPATAATMTPAQLNVAASMSAQAVAGTGAADNVVATAAYPLAYDARVVDTNVYIPASAVGYSSFTRIINTGSVAAPVTAYWLNQDGTVGTGVALTTAGGVTGLDANGKVPANGAIMITPATLETALGAPVAANNVDLRPRVRVSAPTNGLKVQTFLVNPSGIVTELSSNN